MDISRFERHLSQLEEQARQLDKQRGEADKPLFDEHLFSNYPKLVTPCVMQAKHQLDLIEKLLTGASPDPQRLGYLCDHLALQVHALQRELATVAIRAAEPKQARKFYKSINALYQDLTQHIEWERRLLLMRDNKARELDYATDLNRTRMQQELTALEGRVERCRISKAKIEKQIRYQERFE
ncbi:primosomal replication protein [Thaumasiovibrio sp. DFM-14]|uniref:primosomal replication protein n=1 Tax=Thaumasiovibrio sp. DFM-14 TaxID=3384792 RepID=UPI0039A35ADB